MRSTAARLTGIAISATLTVMSGWLAISAAIAAVGTDGTWTDTVSFLACTTAALLFGALAWGGTR